MPKIKFTAATFQKVGVISTGLLLIAIAIVQGKSPDFSKAQVEVPMEGQPFHEESFGEFRPEGFEGEFDEEKFREFEEGEFGEEDFREFRPEEFEGEFDEEDFREFHPADDSGEGKPVLDDDRAFKDAERFLKDQQRFLRDRQRELKHNFRQSKVDTSSAQTLVGEWESILNEMQTALTDKKLEEFWKINERLNTKMQAVNDEFQKLYDQNQKADIGRIMEDKKRFMKDKENSIEQHRKASHDVSELESLLGKMKEKMSEMESLAATEGFDPQDFWDLNADFDELDREFWDINNELGQKFQQENQQKDIDRILKDKNRFMQDKERTIEELSEQEVDVTALQNLLGEMKQKLEAMNSLTKTSGSNPQDFWDLNRDFDELEREFWDTVQPLHEERSEKQGQEDSGRNLKDKERAIREMERQCKRAECPESVLSKIAEFQSLYEQMEKAANDKDFQTFWDLNRDFDNSQGDFWEDSNEIFQAKDMERWFKDVERGLKDMARWMNDMRDEKVVKEARAVYSEMEEIVKKARDAYDKKDYETARDLLEFDLQDKRMAFEEKMRSLEGRRNDDFFKRELEHISREIDQAEKDIDKALKEGMMDSARAELCRGYIQEGRSFIMKINDAFANDHEADAEDLRMEFEALGMKAERDCGDVVRSEPAYDDFNKVYVEERYRPVADEVYERVSKDVAERVLEQLQNNPHLLNKIFENARPDFQDGIAKTFEATAFVPKEYQEEFLSRKAAILAEIQEMETLTARLQELKTAAAKELSDFQAIQQQIAAYNFIGTSGADLEEKLAAFTEEAKASEWTPAEWRKKIAELHREADGAIAHAREEKFENGIIAFLDADDTEWFARYAAEAKDEGFIKGTGESGFSRMEPARNTNLAEAITMFGRVVGEEVSGSPTSAVGKRLPDWAKNGAVALENRGVDLDAIFGFKQAYDSVTRAEVARLLEAVFNLPSGDASDFNDIATASTLEREAIGAVKAAGIMTGEGDGTFFNAKGSLNRAALVKVLIKAKELSGVNE